MNDDNRTLHGFDWHWIAEARLAAMQVQALPEKIRADAATVARTTMLTLTASHTPIGRSPLLSARFLAMDLAGPYPRLEANAAHCAALLFFFDLLESKYYSDIGLPSEFWRFGDVVLSGIGFDHRPLFTTQRAGNENHEAESWLIARADRVGRALSAITDEPGVKPREAHSDPW